MHCFNESAPLANIFDCMKGHNRKLNRLRRRRGYNGGGAVKTQDRLFFFLSLSQTDWRGGGEGEGRQVWAAGLALTREAGRQPATVSLLHGSYPLYPASNCA